ncbi:sensor histidine kinase [Streptomyces sp. ME19-01-6]|uniref:sensor histidine kinase n=1 Tax=Streptomyces sp. ME19-01-6 TaxID=3028686 RepID=UPI0029BDAA5E|nr:histidine kinase [Streptomyces sp. ME19-01-6]MDX3226488.1 histidine kinase [Streptomyces sp. ME19-01-6]
MSTVTMLDRGARIASATGLGALFLAALVTQAVAIAQSWGARYWLPGAVTAVTVCLLALLCRRQRAWFAVAGLAVAAAAITVSGLADLPQEPSPATALGLSVLVGTAIRTLPPVPAGAIAAAGLTVVVGGQFAARPATSGITGVTGVNGLAWLAAVVVGLSLRLLDGRALATAERVRRDERLELARELHDVVAHYITGMLIQAQAAQLVGRKDPGKVADSLADIEACASDALTAMRRVVGLLRDDAAPASPGPERLSALVERFNHQGPRVCLRMPDSSDGEAAWPPEVTSTVYRIVREALTNVQRHAPQAGSVSVTVGHGPRLVTVEVVDDAPPGPGRPAHRGGYGLIGMRERVESLGGTLSAGPRHGAGWSVRATLPIPTGEPS